MSYYYSVKQGNLLQEQDATFVVNASNTQLILGSGVSMAFKRHCGNVLQDEMLQAYEKIDGDLLQGDVVATSSGEATNFKYALHAAVMNYNKGTKYDKKIPTLEIIDKIMRNIEGYLKWYDEQSSKSMKLVLPLMGCGVGGLDKSEVIKKYKKFFDKEISFNCEVVVYGYDNADYELIKSILSKIQIAHNSWSNHYDFVNEQSFGLYLDDLTYKT